MTVTTNANQTTVLGNGVTTNFTYPFIMAAAANAVITYNDTGGNPTTLTPSQYTLVLNPPAAGALWGIGGSVTYPLMGSPIALGTNLIIAREVPYTQPTSLINQGTYYADVVEGALDNLEFQIQQLSSSIANKAFGTWRGTWITGAVYLPGDVVQDGANGTNTQNIYVCLAANTSGVWATDLAAGDWQIVINLAVITAAAAASAAAAAASATAAAGSATSASTSATSATSSATAAAGSATSASTSASAASTSATNAASSASAASTSATNAAASATSASSSATAAAASAATAASIVQGKNRIHNGDMRIDQRNVGASGTSVTLYSVDRWKLLATLSTKGTWQQNAGGVTPPAGFSKYIGYTSNSAYSITAGDYFSFFQGIEGLNVQDLNWGTANAKSVTLSFWVRSSLTGTGAGSFRNATVARSYVFTYTINAANTWEYKTITIAGDTSGTWATDNTAGIYLSMNMACGSTAQGTANAWQAGDKQATSGSLNITGTNGATFYMTGVQLEVGTSATNFEQRDITSELLRCQRYFSKSYALAVVPGTANTLGKVFFVGYNGVGNFGGSTRLATQMRTTPTITYYDDTGAVGKVSTDGQGSGQTATTFQIGETAFTLYVTLANPGAMGFQYTAEAEF